MRNRDEMEEELHKLPSAEMKPERKMKNLQEIKQSGRKRKNSYTFYPITLVVFLAVIGMGYMLMTPNNPTSISERHESTDLQKYFEGVEPIYSDSHISSSNPEHYEKSVAISYLYNAAEFYTLEGEKIHPLTADQDVESYFQYTEKEIEPFTNDPIMLDYKGTIIYLRSANQLIEDEDLSEKLDSLAQKMHQLNPDQTVQYNYEIYKDVSIEVGNIVKEINQVTSESFVYIGENSEWTIRLQPLSDSDYLIYLQKSKREGEMEVTISSPQHGFEDNFKFDYSVGYKFSSSLPKEIANADELKLTITEDGKQNPIVLKRKKLTQLYP